MRCCAGTADGATGEHANSTSAQALARTSFAFQAASFSMTITAPPILYLYRGKQEINKESPWGPWRRYNVRFRLSN
jgi:hypothetical protein